MGAYSQYSRMFKNGIISKAIELHYSADNICILEGDIGKLEREHRQTYDNLMSCRHNRDNRLPIEYARDLVASWIFEDTLVQQLQEGGLQINLSGADRNRKLLATSKVSASSDCQISFNGLSRHTEIMSDYTGWWERTGHMELRDDKYLKLEREKAIFLGVCATAASWKYILLDFAKPVSASYIASHRPYGGKPAYSIRIERAALTNFTMPPLIERLKSMISSS